MKRIITYCLFIMCFAALPAQYSYSQNNVQRVAIAPLNRATIYFSKMPENYESSLAADKRKITLKIPNANVVESARVTRNDGIIEEIYIQTTDKNLEINLSLKDKRGYTAVALPYSKALMVEAFAWDRLSPSEDNYRNGLLALESGITKSAVKYFTKSAKQGNEQAASLLAVLMLKTGNLTLAYEYGLLAERANSNIPDVYACLAQICKMRSDLDKSKQYAATFFKMTGLKTFPELSSDAIEIVDSVSTGPVSLLKMMNDPFYGDSTFFSDTTAIAETDTTKSDSTKIAKKDSTAKSAVESADDVPDWFKYLIIFAVIMVLGLAFIIIFLYLKWRNNQLKAIKKRPKSKSKNGEKDGTIAPASLASKIYARQQNLGVDRSSDSKLTTDTEMHLKEQKNLPRELVTDDADAKQKEQQELELVLNKFRKQAETDLNKEQSSSKKADDEADEVSAAKSAISPKLELAMHLAQEQLKLKHKNIDSLTDNDLPQDAGKLNEFAKKLGIEKGSIETKKAMEKIKSDKQSLSKLINKFSSEDASDKENT